MTEQENLPSIKRFNVWLTSRLDPLISGDIIVHPILAAIYPVLFLKVQNLRWGTPEELLPVIGVSVACTTLIWLLSKLPLRSWRKAALLATIWVIWFFSYDAFLYCAGGIFPSIQNNYYSDERALFVYSLIFVVTLAFTVRQADGVVRGMTGGLNLVLFILVLMNTNSVVVHTCLVEQACASAINTNNSVPNPLPVKLSATPDIYYIILDALASPPNFHEYTGESIDQYAKYFSENGFQTAFSRCNYTCTNPSLSATLNMTPAQNLQSCLGKGSAECEIYLRLIQGNQVARFLKERGYKFVNVGSGSYGTGSIPQADYNFINVPFSDFHFLLLDTTVLQGLEKRLALIGDQVRSTRLTLFDKWNQIEKIPGPKFVLAHIILPHPPFVFKADGKPFELTRAEWANLWSKKEYAGQAYFILDKVKTVVGSILRSDPNAVIVIQGDHGPALPPPKNNLKDPTWVAIKTRNFNVCRFGNNNKRVLYDGITSVNTFRVLFNTVFGTELKMQPDNYFIVDQSTPFDMTDVTGADEHVTQKN